MKEKHKLAPKWMNKRLSYIDLHDAASTQNFFRNLNQMIKLVKNFEITITDQQECMHTHKKMLGGCGGGVV